MDFKVGDSVQLVSGGQCVTIERIIGDLYSDSILKESRGFENGDFICRWWDETKKEFKTDAFKSKTLISCPNK